MNNWRLANLAATGKNTFDDLINVVEDLEYTNETLLRRIAELENDLEHLQDKIDNKDL